MGKNNTLIIKQFKLLYTISVENPGFFSYIKLMAISNSEHDDYLYLIFSSIEFFGDIQYEIPNTLNYITLHTGGAFIPLIAIFILN